MKKTFASGTLAAQNRRAYYDYAIEEKIEAGIVLQGTEVKALRQGRAVITDSHAGEMKGELYLFNAHIPEYGHAGKLNNHEPKRPRKLLLKSREAERLMGKIKEKGLTLVPLSIYFNSRGFAKVELGLGRGKKAYDKRESEKKKDWDREKQRLKRE